MTDEKLSRAEELKRDINKLTFLFSNLDCNHVLGAKCDKLTKAKNIKFYYKSRGGNVNWELDLPESIRQQIRDIVKEELEKLKAEWEAL